MYIHRNGRQRESANKLKLTTKLTCGITQCKKAKNVGACSLAIFKADKAYR